MKLVADGDGLRLVYSLSYGPAGALAVRREMDADRNGRITTAESKADATRLGRRIAEEIVVTVDGDPVPIEWAAPFVGPATGGLDPSPLTIELETSVPLGPGEHVVSLVDVVPLDEIERSDYAFDASAPAELVASGSGSSPSGAERLVSFLERAGETAERRLTARFRLPGSAIPHWPFWAGGAAIVVAAGGAFLVRRGRRRDVSEPRTGR